MKIKRFTESASLEEELEFNIREIIQSEVYTQNVIYSDDIEVSSDR